MSPPLSTSAAADPRDVERSRAARVLILTAGFGEGHNAAARALSAAVEAEAGPGSAPVVDLFALAAPRLNAVTRRAYLGLINRAPQLWRHTYAWMDRSPLVTRSFVLLRREQRLLAMLLQRDRPRVVLSTYPIYAYLLARLARSGEPVIPHYNVVTDSISIHSLWWRAPCDGWFVPNEDSADVLRQAGLPPDRLQVCGFPVHSFFQAHEAELFPPALDAAGPAPAPRVLCIIHSGNRHAEATASRLLAESDWEVTFAVGRNERLRRRLGALAAGRARPAQILGWTDQIPRLLMTHHAVVSKAGGATTQEAIAARCPMIVNQIVPGQEEGNYELLRRHGVGALAETPEAIIAALRRAFADRGRVWQAWRSALAPLARTGAAREIARRVLATPAGGSLPGLPDPEPIGANPALFPP